jgi:hypothetical protein
MKSGKKTVKISLAAEFAPEDYKYHHRLVDCDGGWGVLVQENVPFPLNGLGTALLPMAAFVACPKCKAAFLLPGFQDLIERSIATELVLNERILTPKELRFLRLTFDLTQQEVIDEIEADSVSYYSKCETGKPGHALSVDKQVRLKLFYATKLGINRAEDYHRIHLTSAKRDEPEQGPVINLHDSIDERIEELKRDFQEKYHLEDLNPGKQA